jgi:hypothetical protein
MPPLTTLAVFAASVVIGASPPSTQIAPTAPLVSPASVAAAPSNLADMARMLTAVNQPHSLLDMVVANPLLTGSFIAGGIALIVGLLTFFGVMLSLGAATRRMRTELGHAAFQALQEREYSRDEAIRERQHAALEAHRERIATMRRTVYLEAITELVQTQIYIGGLAKVDITKVNIVAGLERFLVAVARVAIVSEQPTALMARSVASLFVVTILKGLKFLAPMVQLKADVAFHEKQYAATQTEIQRILAAMTHFNETLQKDQEVFAALQRSFGYQHDLAAKHTAKTAEANLQLGEAEKLYSAAVKANVKVAATKLDELACAIRTELGLETNVEEFHRQTAELHEQMDAALREIQTDAALPS